jgi:MoaA/NifB/PqqE/SkfB family radical SAM enzyme
MQVDTTLNNDYGPQRLSLELANICNLHCSYCLRSEDNLYNTPAAFFPLDLLRRLVKEAAEVAQVKTIIFTGGEPTLHPNFADVLEIVGAGGLTAGFVTNGWHFERTWPALVANRKSIARVAFSLDGITRETHDKWRGQGSFDRLVRAFTRCYMSALPFAIKMVIRRDMVDQLEQTAIFAARMGASNLSFVHLMPTSEVFEECGALNMDERRAVEQEIAILARILKMNIGLDVGYYNIDEDRPPCSPLAGTSMNIDFKGRLSLCCNLSGFRGASENSDVVADLNVESFASAFEKFQAMIATQLQNRKEALAHLREQGITPDLYTGSPCLFCMQTYGKIPWHNTVASLPARSLPVHNNAA